MTKTESKGKALARSLLYRIRGLRKELPAKVEKPKKAEAKP